MIKNFLTIAFRNLWHNKMLAVLNILGLAIGISATMVITTIIFYEFSYDDFHEDRNRIFRVVTEISIADDEFHSGGIPIPLGQTIIESIAGIDEKAMFHTIGKNKVENNEENLIFRNPDKIVYADKSFFDLFKYDWLAGDFSKILSNPNEVVLTNERAQKYFPGIKPQNTIGKTLLYNDTIPVTVVGIVSDLKKATDLYFQEFISTKSASNFGEKELVDNGDWFNSSSSTQVFVKINSKRKIQAIENSLAQIAKAHTSTKVKEINQNIRFFLQPFSNLHFNAKYGIFDDSEYQGNKSALLGLSLVAIFLLLLSIVNFVNLNTAQGLKRSKEIGIRKTLGGSRSQLIFQFLGEALFLTIISTLLSLLISVMLIRVFEDFIPGKIDYSILASYKFVILNINLIIAVTFLAGFYPAIILSNYKPTSVLKNTVDLGKNKTSSRKILTTFQLVIAQLFIISTIIVAKQVHLLTNKDIGFRTKSVINLRLNQISELSERLTFVRELEQIPNINSVSLNSGNPFQAMMAFPMKFMKNGNETTIYAIKIDGDLKYRKLFEIELIAGRERLNDTIEEFVINEKYSKALGFEKPEEALGNTIYFKQKNIPIVGVMKDFNNIPLQYEVQPIALAGNNYDKLNYLNFALEEDSDKKSKALNKVERLWEQMFPNAEFIASFVDERMQGYYEQEHRTSFIMKWASILAIIISCMGLLGLVIYTTERRTKEIGIRKVLGASSSQLNFLLMKEFLILVGIGFIITIPFAYLTSDNWLNRFAYKASISWWTFLIGGVIMAVFALAVVSFKTFSCARANPVKSLRTD